MRRTTPSRSNRSSKAETETTRISPSRRTFSRSSSMSAPSNASRAGSMSSAATIVVSSQEAPLASKPRGVRPDAVVDLLEAHVLLGENGADVQPAVVGGDDAIVLPTDAAVAAHAANFEVRGVLHLGELSGVRTW